MEPSAKDPTFISKLCDWINCNGEIFVVVRYPAAAGAKDYFFIQSEQELNKLLSSLPPRTSVIAFESRQLCLRGIVDEMFIANALTLVADGEEFSVFQFSDTNERRYAAGDSHEELVVRLRGRRGKNVAFGPTPPWWEDKPGILEVIIPDTDGTVTRSVY